MNEPRHCFKEQAHEPHTWEVKNNAGLPGRPEVLVYDCDGSDVTRDPWGPAELVASVREPDYVKAPEDETRPAPGILDGRAAYGDRVQNMKEQAAMITAYLSGRSVVEAHDVPMILNLIKIHRLGKMPDYGDNYDDIEGYTTIAREVIGDDMINAATAKEYRWKKSLGHQGEGRMIDHHQNPYRNVERDDIRDMGLDESDHRL